MTHLYAKNMLADIYNRDCISQLPGDLYTFISTDTGDARDLQDLVVSKILWLMVGAKVVLLQNLSDMLVNGLQGIVESISQETSIVSKIFHVFTFSYLNHKIGQGQLRGIFFNKFGSTQVRDAIYLAWWPF